MTTKKPDTISGLMRRRVSDNTKGEAPASDYDRLLAEYRQLQNMFQQQQQLIGELKQENPAETTTGLANRRTLLLEIERSLATAKRYGRTHGLLAISLGDFAGFQALGEDSATAVLQHAARLLRQNIRPTDIAASFGNHHFAVILNELRAADNATFRATELLHTIETTPCITAKHTLQLHAEITPIIFTAEDEANDLMARLEITHTS